MQFTVFPCKVNAPQVKGNLISTMMDIMFWDFSILYQFFFSQQVEGSVIISYKHGKSELPYELWSDLGLRILKIRKTSETSQNIIESKPSVQPPSQNKHFIVTSKQLSKIRNSNFTVVSCFTDCMLLSYHVHVSEWIHTL